MLLCASYLSCVPSFVEWILCLILLLEIWLKLKFIYLHVYYEILIYWVLLALFSLTLLLFRQCFFLFLLFFCFFFNFVKPKLFYQHLFEGLRKQQLRAILLNMCFQFDKPYKIMQAFSNILQYPENISTLSQRCC